jgi:hypothetical protein
MDYEKMSGEELDKGLLARWDKLLDFEKEALESIGLSPRNKKDD